VSSSSNSAANAVTLRGVSITSGDGFHGDLVVAGNVTVDSTTLHVDAETNRVGLGTVRPGQLLDVRGAANVGVLTATSGTVTDATHSTSKDTGVIVVTQGGLGVEANIHSTNVFAASHIAVGTSATSNTFDVRGTANVGALVTTSTHISDSTVSTSKTSGALLVTGGAGVTGELHAADTTLDSVKLLNMSTTTLPITDGSKKLVNSFITQDNGTLVINANVEITGNISVVGNTFQVTSNDLVITDRIITLANNNTEHDLDIGIIMEHPNYNIGIIHHGSTHVGGAPGHHLSMGYINEGPDADSVTWKNDAHITANVWGHLITQNTVTVEYGNVYIVDGGLGIGIGDGENDNVPDSKLYVTGNAHVTSNISTDSNVIIGATTESTSTTTGALRVAGGVGIGENLFVGGTGKIENDTDASSTTTGALQVLGGLGVVKSIHAADTTFESVNITDSTNSTDKDTGALIVQSGGAGIELNLNVGGVTKVWDETDATTTTSGALQVLGGLGVAKSIHAADTTFESVTVTDTTHSTTKDTGAIIVQNGGLGVESNIYATNVFAASHIYANVSTAVASANVLDIRGTANVGALVTLSTHISETTTSTSTTTGALQVAGGAGIVENLFVGGTGKIEDDTDASSTTTGALQVVGGLGVAKTIFAADLSSGSVDVTDTTEATDTLTGTLTVAGGISTQTNVHAANVYISGGLITNTAGVTKKTYSFTGALDSGQTIANSTIKITFSAHVFYAKIVAHLIESDNEVSTLSMECGGGHRTGGTPLTIAKGPTSVFGSASTNPWNSAVAATTTTVALAPTTDMAAAGNYNIFIEYISAHPSGAVTKITEGSTDVITFGY
jgi:hypothetical protein